MTLTKLVNGERVEMSAAEIEEIEAERERIAQLPPEVPGRIHRKQAKLQLLKMGLLDQIEPEFEKLAEPGRSIALIEWKEADYYHRDHPLIGALAGIFGLTDSQVDQMFIEAAKL